ncbi:acyltransferase [Enterobacter chuandaensis]|uniref:acyltransferase n=1 Tax=Enterobacter chuandaensis TaxID=2497875 RepID=UPI0039C40853
MNIISKAYCSALNIIYLTFLKCFSTNKVSFNSIRIGKRFNIAAYDKATIVLNNLSARNNLNIFVQRGLLMFEEGCFVNNNCSFNCLEKIVIGENTIFGESVKVYDHDHLINEDYSTCKNKFVTSPVRIGANCWIGTNTVILKGVSIVDNVVVGANSFINKSIKEPGIYVNKNGSLTKIK